MGIRETPADPLAAQDETAWDEEDLGFLENLDPDGDRGLQLIGVGDEEHAIPGGEHLRRMDAAVPIPWKSLQRPGQDHEHAGRIVT